MKRYINSWKLFVESEESHRKALEDTGFWGKQAAGAIIMAEDTKRFLVAHRSEYVEQPGTWGTWGGAMDEDETPEEAVRREVMEEAGATSLTGLYPLWMFSSGTFRYHNFLAVVPEEFNPELDWETQGYKWVEFGDWPEPLHFGLETLLEKSSEEIRKLMEK
jgi:8-oxo-dGTP pyrophosphatase MutT (NUDIX family)